MNAKCSVIDSEKIMIMVMFNYKYKKMYMTNMYLNRFCLLPNWMFSMNKIYIIFTIHSKSLSIIREESRKIKMENILNLKT